MFFSLAITRHAITDSLTYPPRSIDDGSSGVDLFRPDLSTTTYG